MYFRKNTLKKFDLQESYNNLKINLKISFVNQAPGFYLHHVKVAFRDPASGSL